MNKFLVLIPILLFTNLALSEIFVISCECEKPTKWSDPDGVTVSEGGRVATRIRTEPNTGRISNAWSLDENDSRGKVKVDVYVDDQLIQTFHSEVK